MAPYWRGDYATAMRLLRPIADEGSADAQLRLGHMYASGQGVPQDDATAVTWFRKATDQGNAAAQTYLGFMYQSGRGGPQDHVLAYVWFTLAAVAGNTDAPKNRALVATRMTPAQIAEAQRIARERNFMAVVPDP
jgi:TPR repeat protein